MDTTIDSVAREDELHPLLVLVLAREADARLNWAQVIQIGARERSQSREEKMEPERTREQHVSRARLTRVLA